jgi:hypothetical protein
MLSEVKMTRIRKWHRHKLVERLLLSLSLLCSCSAAQADQVTASDSQGVCLTIYNQDFGVVKDVRNVELKEGINHLRFEDVAAKIDPTTVSFLSLTAPNSVVVREQNYQYDLMDPITILSKSVGKTIKIRQYTQAGTHELQGVLLNSAEATVVDTSGRPSARFQGLVIKTASGVILNPQGEIELAELPPGLVAKPSLLWKLESSKAGTHKTEISYQTAGLNWRCDYVAIANEDDSKTDLTSWVTLDNKSGASYTNASLKLLAGDVHKVKEHEEQAYGAKMEMAGVAGRPQFEEHAFAEYHMYALQGKTTVSDNETKQLSLFNATDIPTKKLFVFEPEIGGIWYAGGYLAQQDPNKVHVKVEIQNTESNGLGLPLPKGKVRVYKRDKDGALEFIGEDMIDHTPRDEKVRLYIGDAFDLVGEQKQTNQVQVSNRVQRLSYEISLRNHKDAPVTIVAVEHAWGDWKITNSNHDYTKKDAHTFEFTVKVPAREEVKIDYEIENRW